MRRCHLVIFITVCLFLLIPEWETAMGRAKVSETPPAIKAHQAFLVFTRESWGCLHGQEIKVDVTAFMTGDGAQGARLEEIKNPEDRQDRLELYLYFPAQPVSGLPGYLVLKLLSSGPDPEKPGSVLLKQAELRSGPQGPVFKLRGNFQGNLTAALLYAEDFGVYQGLFACPEADLFEPRKINFLKAYAVKTGLEAERQRPPGAGESLTILLGNFWLKETREVAAAAELLDRLDKTFKVSGALAFLWDKSKITSQAFEALASAWDLSRGARSNITLILWDRQGTREIRRSPTPFTPQLRQKIALQDAQGRISGGEIWLALDLPR